MRIKSSKGERLTECPQDKLKFLSFIDDLQSTRALHPVTPQRSNKEWVMDAWEDHSQYDASSPQKNKYINKMIQNYEGKSFRLKKVQFFSQKIIHNNKISTPMREHKITEESPVEKQNQPREKSIRKIRPRLYSINKPSRKTTALEQELTGPYKSSIRQLGILRPRSRMECEEEGGWSVSIPLWPVRFADDGVNTIDGILYNLKMQNSDNIEPDELQHIRKIFNKFDINGDGNITFEELSKAMRILGMNPTMQQITTIINEYDLDGDGHIDFSQYKQIYMARRPLPTQKEVLEAFREFDRNGTGLLDVKKIQAMAERMQMQFTNEEVRKIIEELDEDQDGYINWVQFKNAILD